MGHSKIIGNIKPYSKSIVPLSIVGQHVFSHSFQFTGKMLFKSCSLLTQNPLAIFPREEILLHSVEQAPLTGEAEKGVEAYVSRRRRL